VYVRAAELNAPKNPITSSLAAVVVGVAAVVRLVELPFPYAI
jgi:hypothetical protein